VESLASAALMLASVAFNIGCDPAGGVACQDAHNIQFCSLNTRTKNTHGARDEDGRYTMRILLSLLLKPISNAYSCHLQGESYNTHSQPWDVAYR